MSSTGLRQGAVDMGGKTRLSRLAIVAVLVLSVSTLAPARGGGISGEPISTASLGDWSDDFDSYGTGSQMHGQGGWKGWFNDPAGGAIVSDEQAISTPNSLEIVGDSDLVREFTGIDSGQWTVTAWQFVPSEFSGESFFIQLNNYNDDGVGLNWSTQVRFVSSTNEVVNDGSSGGSLSLIRNQWVELRTEIDLDSDTQEFFYGGQLLYSSTWTDEVSGGGSLNFDTIDLFANGASAVFYDDMSVAEADQVLQCGDTVVGVVVLTEDLGPCPGTGLFIGAPGTRIRGNGHRLTGLGNGVGIRMLPGVDATDVVVRRIIVKDFNRGVVLKGDGVVKVLGSRVLDHERRGVVLVAGKPVVKNTLASRNGTEGIFTNPANRAVVENNKANNNGRHGIQSRGPKASIDGNVVRNNTGLGIKAPAFPGIKGSNKATGNNSGKHKQCHPNRLC